MIEVKKSKDVFNACNSCGSEENLLEIGIRRGRSLNTTIICLCRNCVQEIFEQTMQVAEGE